MFSKFVQLIFYRLCYLFFILFLPFIVAENCKFTDTPHPFDRVTGDTVPETNRIDGQGNFVIVTDENAPHFSGTQFNRGPGIERVGQEGVCKSS